MAPIAWIDPLLRQALRVTCRVEGEGLARVPRTGPLILYTNHTAQLEVLLLRSLLQPRSLTGLVKRELWRRPLLGPLLDRWGAIPMRRDGPDLPALRAALGALDRGRILGIAPEGVLSRDGILRPARQGAALLAARSGAPLLPIAHWGVEAFGRNLRRLRRTTVHVRVGEPFVLDLPRRTLGRGRRQLIVDGMMRRLAELMPEQYHGAYAG